MSKDQVVHIGEESIKQLQQLIVDLNPGSIFIVRGKQSYESSGAKSVLENCIQSGCRIVEFSDFSQNPIIEDLYKGLEFIEHSKSDLIIGIGGGSVLDMAKLIRFCHSYSGEPTGNAFTKQKELIPLIAIPTTAGTGSEATQFSVLYKEKVKYSLEHNEVLPDYAIIYPPFTYNNPKYLTACSGFDALAQGIEAFWSVNATEESDEYALKAIELLFSNLPLAVNSPTNEIRKKMIEGSYWAGKAINIAKTTAPHAFSYPFTSFYGIPHGHAVALTFPFFVRFNVMNESAYFILSKKNKLLQLINSEAKFSNKLMKNYIKKIGLDFEKAIDFDFYSVVSNVNLNRLKNNPINFTEQDLKDLKDEIEYNK